MFKQSKISAELLETSPSASCCQLVLASARKWYLKCQTFRQLHNKFQLNHTHLKTGDLPAHTLASMWMPTHSTNLTVHHWGSRCRKLVVPLSFSIWKIWTIHLLIQKAGCKTSVFWQKHAFQWRSKALSVVQSREWKWDSAASHLKTFDHLPRCRLLSQENDFYKGLNP